MYFILYIMQAWTPNLYFVSIWITTRIQRSFFLRYSRHTVLPTKPRKLFQRPVELFIWIHENTWESSNSRLFFETFSVKHNVHFLWGQRKRIFFFFCFALCRIYTTSICQMTLLRSVLSTTAMVRWVSPEVTHFLPDGFKREFRTVWNSWRSSVSLFALWNSRDKHFGSWFCFCHQVQ